MQRLKGYTEAGLARQCMPAGQVQYWLKQGWNKHQIRHWHSLRKVKRDEAGNIIRWDEIEAGPTKSQDKMVTRTVERAIIEERKLYRGVCHMPQLC
eukprot:697774-Pyramimonas_sp.AAC.1